MVAGGGLGRNLAKGRLTDGRQVVGKHERLTWVRFGGDIEVGGGLEMASGGKVAETATTSSAPARWWPLCS